MNHAMKRILAMIAALLMLLVLAGCEDKPTPVPQDTQLPVEQETPSQETPDAEEKLEAPSAQDAPAESVTETPSDATEETPFIEELHAAEDYDEIYTLFVSVQDAANALFSISEEEDIYWNPVVNPDAERYGDPVYPAVLPDGVQRGTLSAADGSRIYMVSTGELVIIEADGANTKELGRAFVTSPSPDGYNGSELPQAVYVSGDYVIVVTYESLFRNYENDGEVSYDATERVHVKRYDVSDPSAPVIVSDFAQSGRYLDSYLSDGVLYLIGAHSIWRLDEEDPATYVPVLTQNGEDQIMEASSVILCPKLDSTDYTVISALDVTAGSVLSSKAVTGYHPWNETDGTALFLAGTSYYYDVSAPYEEAQYTVNDYDYRAYTRLIRMEMDGTLSVSADALLDGYLLDGDAISLIRNELYLATMSSSYSFRVFTDEVYGFVNQIAGDRASSPAAYQLDKELTVTEQISELNVPSDIYMVRMADSTAYYVDYEGMEPDYFVDLSVEIPVAETVSGVEDYAHHLYAFTDGLTVGTRVSEDGMLILCAYGDELSLLSEIDVSENWEQAMNAPESVHIFAEEKIVAIPVGTVYSLFRWENGSFMAMGDAPLGYVSADTGAFHIGDCWYFCNDAAVVVLDNSLEELMRTEFAYG